MCAGPPLCTGFHSQIYVDGTEIIAATNPELRGLDPDTLLRAGGPLYPADYERHAGVAYLRDSCGVPECHGLTVRIRLARDAVIWSGIFYQDFDGNLVEQARFDLGDYLGVLAEAREDRCWEPPSRRLERLIRERLERDRALLRFGATGWRIQADDERSRVVVTMWFPGEQRDGGESYTVALPLKPELDHDRQVEAVVTTLTSSDPRGRLARDLPAS